jgi:hypothetical protein
VFALRCYSRKNNRDHYCKSIFALWGYIAKTFHLRRNRKKITHGGYPKGQKNHAAKFSQKKNRAAGLWQQNRNCSPEGPQQKEMALRS